MLSEEYGLGEVQFDLIPEKPSPERVFTIHVDSTYTSEELNNFLSHILEHMEEFSKKKDLYEYYKTIYITFVDEV